MLMWETVEASSDLIVNCAAGLGFRVLVGFRVRVRGLGLGFMVYNYLK